MTLTAAARSRVKSQALPDPRWHTHVVTAITLTAALLLASSCGEDDPVQPVQVKAALQDRSFRQWEISAADYRLEKAGDAKFQDAEFVIHFEDPESAREFPDKCDDCIPTKDFSISVRSALDGDRISFKLNDPGNRLPSPFPVFESWTRFREDEYFE